MNKFEIHIMYDPKPDSKWKVSYGHQCFKTWNKRMALRCAKDLALMNRPSRIIIQAKAGNAEKHIEYLSEFEEKIPDRTKRYLSQLRSSETPIYLPAFIAVMVIGALLSGPWLLWVYTSFQLRLLRRYLKNQINTLATIKFSFRKVWSVHHTAQKTPLGKPPGTHLLAVVDFLYSPKTVELTFKPLVADWRTEYFDALKQGRIHKARWISVRYRYSFLKAMGLSKVFALLRQLLPASK